MKTPYANLKAACRGMVMAAGCLGASLVFAATVHADGSLPPQPYRYLHPPPAFAKNNLPPLTGRRVLPVDYMRKAQWFGFTDDGQAGISGDKAAFRVRPGTTGVVIRMDPVNTPPGLPAQDPANGNAYRIEALEQPDNRPATLVKHVDITLRWPHVPIAMFEYLNGKWLQICNRDQLIISPTTMSCSTRALGIFVGATKPSAVAAVTPSSSQRWLSRAIPWIIALAVLVIAATLGYFVTRSRQQTA